jgi:crotonobetainyl-CoA:carnitine CoA-transferase CaiB-like acyl-CoA transferase
MAAGLFGISRVQLPDRKRPPNPLVNTYRTSDGRFLSLIMLQADRFWGETVRAIGRPDLEHDPRFVDSAARAQNMEACVTALDDTFASRTFAEWREVLMGISGVWAPMLTASELLEDPQALANGYVRDVETPSGTTFRMVPSPLQFDESPPDLVRAPDHGEHTDEVLLELGLDMDAILQLKIDGAVL